jgi:hypothetical protein
VVNITINLGEIRFKGIDWIGLAEERQVEASCICGIEPSGSMKC